jgi:hypothetical protein
MAKVITTYVHPAIPVREFDYQSTLDGYEPGEPIGWGATPAESVADLMEQIEDLLEERLEQ